ncbi:acyl carrier protein phosphodiesterase [Vibrio sp. WJH972]
MNYLAHLHIAQQVNSSLLGNLLGDFVKGAPPEQLGSSVQRGIFLHRRVDQFTDSHPISKELKLLFKPTSRRFVPIALDMFWDHCLAKHWTQYDSTELLRFVAQSEKTIMLESEHLELPLSFQQVSQKLWSQQWLVSYQAFDNITYALERISTRRPRLAGLTQCISGLEQHYDELNSQFSHFYPEVLEEAKAYQSRFNE